MSHVCARRKNSLSHSLADLWIVRRADVLHANGGGKIVSRRSLDKRFKGKVYCLGRAAAAAARGESGASFTYVFVKLRRFHPSGDNECASPARPRRELGLRASCLCRPANSQPFNNSAAASALHFFCCADFSRSILAARDTNVFQSRKDQTGL